MENNFFNRIGKVQIVSIYRKPWWTITMLILLIVCEILVVSKAYHQSNNILSQTPWHVVLPLVGLFLFLVIFGVYNKVYAFDKLIIKDFLTNSLAAGYIAITFLITFIITGAFVPTVIRDFVAGEQLAWWGLIACILAIPLEVLIYPITVGIKTCPLGEREILVSAMSAVNSDYQNKGFCYPFEACRNIKELWVIVSQQCLDMAKHEHTDISDSIQAMTAHIKSILLSREPFKTNPELIYKLEIHISKPVDFNDFDNCYKMSKVIFNEIGKEKACRTIINISPGTAMISSVLSMFAIQGNRMLGYNRQVLDNKNPFTISESNVLSMKELIEEMIIEIQNNRQ